MVQTPPEGVVPLQLPVPTSGKSRNATWIPAELGSLKNALSADVAADHRDTCPGLGALLQGSPAQSIDLD